MRFVRALLAYLWLILRTLLYKWIVSLIALFRLYLNWFEVSQARARLPSRLRKSPPQACVKISDPAYKRPDPLIYDQVYLMSQGLAVTWDNPDIWLQQGGVTVSSDQLTPATTYDVIARIWNNSTEAPVIGLPVTFSYLSFGIGTQSHPIGKTSVDLGVKGGPQQPAFATIPWTTPVTPGHYCIQVSFTWIDDANPNNNLGQENTLVGMAHSPAVFEFQLRNDTRLTQAFRLEADAYAIPPLPTCDQQQSKPQRPVLVLRQKPGTIAYVPPQHDRRNHPLPVGWSIDFSPPELLLDPGQEVTVQATVGVPDDFVGRQAINVHAFTRTQLAGGVTLYVVR